MISCPLFSLRRSLHKIHSGKYAYNLATVSLKNNLQAGLLHGRIGRNPESGLSFFKRIVKVGDTKCVPLAYPGALNTKDSTSPCFSPKSSLLWTKDCTRKQKKLLKISLLLGILSLFLQTSVIGSCFATMTEPGSLVSYSNCIKALVGEVENQDLTTVTATAEVIRTRIKMGLGLRGIYGINSKRISKASPQVWAKCELGWANSAKSNLVRGASVWGNASDLKKFKKSRWFKSYEFVARYGSHYFFRKRGVK